MNDDSALGTVRDSLTAAKDSLTEVQMSTPLGTIVGHGQATRRRRRLMGLAATGTVAVAAALAVGLAGSAPAHGTGTIQTAAFTLVSNANGTATLTIKPMVLLEPATLQRDLARDGIPAKVTVGSFCFSDPAPAGLLRVVPPPRTRSFRTITINPAAMPAGTELSFGNFQLTNSEQTNFALIDKDSYTCTSHATPLQPRTIAIAYMGRAS
jgi:F0F1-type ATP synthase membrane subunit c/vacuolar-type H+-ATPase subunit K